jgi:hypothetical protein
MAEHDELLDRAAEMLRESVELSADFDARVMNALATLPTPRRPGPVRRAGLWLVRPRPVRVRPAVALAAAAALAIAFVGLRTRPSPLPAATSAAAAGTTQPVRFMLVAPHASSVAIVGDFNDWTVGRTALSDTVSEGLWSVTVPLQPGRYRYAFVVDGATWVPDPSAPPALDDDFGRPNSVVTIGGS